MFGISGKVVFSQVDAYANDLLVEANGFVVVGEGLVNNERGAHVTVRYNHDGTLDADFGVGGVVVDEIR